MYSSFRVSPLVNPQSYHYVVDLVLLRPLVATGRAISLFRPRLRDAFEQAVVVYQRGGHDVAGKLKENIQLSAPPEKKEARPTQAERVCPARPQTRPLG